MHLICPIWKPLGHRWVAPKPQTKMRFVLYGSPDIYEDGRVHSLGCCLAAPLRAPNTLCVAGWLHGWLASERPSARSGVLRPRVVTLLDDFVAILLDRGSATANVTSAYSSKVSTLLALPHAVMRKERQMRELAPRRGRHDRAPVRRERQRELEPGWVVLYLGKFGSEASKLLLAPCGVLHVGLESADGSGRAQSR